MWQQFALGTEMPPSAPIRLDLETRFDRCRTVGLWRLIGRYCERKWMGKRTPWERWDKLCCSRGHINQPRRKVPRWWGLFHTGVISSRFPLTEDPQNDYDLPPCKSSLSDDNVDYDTSPTVQCNQQSSFVRSFSRFKLKLSSWFIPFRLRVIWDSCGNWEWIITIVIADRILLEAETRLECFRLKQRDKATFPKIF
jgi:hypothetical protein